MGNDFQSALFVDSPELLGARWWNHAAARRVYTRRALIAASVGGFASFVAYQAIFAPGDPVYVGALEMQRARGWSVDGDPHQLTIPDAVQTDITNSDAWRGAMRTLATDLAPRFGLGSATYRPTLFQSLDARDSHTSGLAEVMRPMSNASLVQSFARGRALSDALRGVHGVTTVVDLPGPESVAFAAGMSDRFEAVFVFDNWPHPRGAVPSHLTLAATLFFRPLFVAPASELGREPVIVLDRNRLASSRSHFDNRYFAPISHGSLRERRFVLYVHDSPSSTSLESDDLNTLLSSLDASGTVAMRALAVGDLAPCADVLVEAATLPFAVPIATEYATAPRYCYGGSSTNNLASVYGFTPGLPADRPPNVSSGPSWRPTRRDTIFGHDIPISPPETFASIVTAGEARGCQGGGGGGSHSRGYGGWG